MPDAHNVSQLIAQLIDELEHAESLGQPAIAVESVLPVLREIRDYYRERKDSDQTDCKKAHPSRTSTPHTAWRHSDPDRVIPRSRRRQDDERRISQTLR